MSLDQNTLELENLYEFHQMMVSQNLFLVYNGPVTQEITNSFLSITKNKIREFVEEKSILRKIGFIMVECLQNIYKHEAKLPAGKKNNISSIFMLGAIKGDFIIESGNRILNKEIASVTERLEKINGMNHKDLVFHYKESLRNTKTSKRGGAGLGFIDAAIKSGQKFEFYFKKIDNKFSFFSLRIRVAKNKAA